MASRIEQKQQARERRIAAEQEARRQDRRRARLMRLGLVLGLAVVVVVVAVVVSSNSGSNASSGGGNNAAAATSLFKGIPQDGIHLGDPSAKATLIEFADLQCPYCAQYSNDALPTVIKRYVRPGTLRYELHVRSFLGDDSKRAAAAAAVAAQENRLYQFADLFYARQPAGAENTGYVTDDFIRSIANATGVDPDKAVKAASDPSSQPMVKQAEQQASGVGSTSTPDFYLRLKSGRLVPVRPQDLTGDAMVQAIEQALPGPATTPGT